jgi:hypothetical protein
LRNRRVTPETPKKTSETPKKKVFVTNELSELKANFLFSTHLSGFKSDCSIKN